jgi:uridine kinase
MSAVTVYDNLVKDRCTNPTIIGVAGGTGSGKTTVVSAIIQNLGDKSVLVIQHDAYYRDRSHLSPDERAMINYDHPDALETPLLVQHLRELQAGRSVELPSYDFATHTRRSERALVWPCPVIIVEGILILAEPALRKMFDIKVFVDTDADIRFIRRLERDIADRGRTRESVVKQYLESVRPMHMEFVEPSKRYADIIIPEGGRNTVAVDMLIIKIQSVVTASMIPA